MANQTRLITAIVDELARRERSTGAAASAQGATTLDESCTLDLLALLLSMVAPAASTCPVEFEIQPSPGTSVACTSCGRINASAYYLKHSHGRYALLCFDKGEGCWEHSARANCSYVDQHAAQCPDLAEWVVSYGVDLLKERHVCSLHIPAVMSDASVHHIFPLQD